MSETKDCWDKFDILVKPLIAVIAAVALFVWNNERTQQQTVATMSQIAVGILSSEVEAGANDPLRKWAVEVLKNPSSPPKLSTEAADALLDSSLPRSFTNIEALERLTEKLNQLKFEQPRPLGDDLQ